MGKFFDLIERHATAQGFQVSDRQLARRYDVSPSTIKNWRNPKGLIDKEHLLAVSQVTGVPYHRVLDALLEDLDLLREESDGNAAPMNETG